MQRTRWLVIAGIAVVAGLAASFGAGQAAVRAAGTGPADALPLPAGSQTLAAGQTIWYAFQYAGDNSPVLVRLNAGPAGAVTFAVWSPTDVDRWAHGGAASPAGRGSASAVYGGDLIWAGSSRFPGTWYVVVEGSRQVGGTFSLAVSGSGVTNGLPATAAPPPTYGLPLPALMDVAAATPVPAGAGLLTPIPPAAAVVSASSSSAATFRPYAPTPTQPAQYPAQALAVSAGAVTLAPGQHRWYAFQYLGDKSQITVDLQAGPAGSAAFDVWSPGQLRLWGLRWNVAPDGSGSPNAHLGGDLVWTGWSKVPGTWYVEVKQTGALATTFTLRVSGSGVGYDLPPTPVPTPTYSLPLPAPYTVATSQP